MPPGMLAQAETGRRTPAEPGRPAPTGTRVRRRTGPGSPLGSSAVPQAADGVARAGLADPGVRAGWPGHTPALTIVPVRGVLREIPGELKAFTRKPEHADPDDVSPAAGGARALAAVCISCAASILGPTAPAQAGTPGPRYSVSCPLTTIGPSKCPVRPNQVTTIRSRRGIRTDNARAIRTFAFTGSAVTFVPSVAMVTTDGRG